jgi:hypothetical protein
MIVPVAPAVSSGPRNEAAGSAAQPNVLISPCQSFHHYHTFSYPLQSQYRLLLEASRL